ncbi:GPW/gp25 family protein [Pseudooceanicola sp. CBS1P-1]|uniref:IraD/Gp25-like domain-containing protein n=1 Tax=Pseudooceanicola albus TaxID=2692189 RepID=A0A6L7FXC6_9RHOB|nr:MULTISPECIES: GPW/gp25 family protein [Pseudooceanicola]MBT9383328.1 GPW/gp25 family protein [Pseudooceanicola endophyticus]MXN16349.1 hypothetical protein [Pseudooceanicola albus]
MDLDPQTGGTVTGWAHVVQSLQTLMRTRLNTRVFRREFGSGVPQLIDAPMNSANVLALYVAVAEAIDVWEPRFELTDVALEANAQGQFTMTLTGAYLPNAHLGDMSTVSDDTRTVKVQATGADVWSTA